MSLLEIFKKVNNPGERCDTKQVKEFTMRHQIMSLAKPTKQPKTPSQNCVTHCLHRPRKHLKRITAVTGNYTITLHRKHFLISESQQLTSALQHN